MNKQLFTGAFVVGAAVVLWVGAGFFGGHVLALAMTLAIATVYCAGAYELHHYRQATATLSAALATITTPPQTLADWLGRLHPSLQNATRLRIEGERIGLPSPTLTPYLVGLLVMLGMLGTFLGMVVTLSGAVAALEGTTDLAAMRSVFAAPIKGLGLAFGTSVAGVASSAMLGLMSAISRRERLQVSQSLDSAIASTLRSFSLRHQRHETYQALHAQSQALPAVAGHLQALIARLERTDQDLSERLSAQQLAFQNHTTAVFTDLAASVNSALQDSLRQSAHIAGDSLKPVLQTALTGLAHEAQHMHARMANTTQAQLASLSERLAADAVQAQAAQAALDRERLQTWTASLADMAATLQMDWAETGSQNRAQHAQICDTLVSAANNIAQQSQATADHLLGHMGQLMASSDALVHTRMEAEARWTQAHSARMDEVAQTLRTELATLHTQEAARGDAAVARLGDLQTTVTRHLATLGTALEGPITRLIHTAAEAPRAAAEVIGQLRQEISNSTARDNALLEERSRILETLNTLLGSINHASVEQRAVIDSLVASSAVALQHASSEFSGKLGDEATKLASIAAQVGSSAVEVSSLSDAFAFAVRSFGEANDKLITNLQRIESGMEKSMLRSDEQMAYYVAQAREIIDLSVGAQKQVFDALSRLPAQQARATHEVA